MDTQELLEEVIDRFLNEEITEWNYIEIGKHRYAVKVVAG